MPKDLSFSSKGPVDQRGLYLRLWVDQIKVAATSLRFSREGYQSLCAIMGSTSEVEGCGGKQNCRRVRSLLSFTVLGDILVDKP